jgi:hypothetical protein
MIEIEPSYDGELIDSEVGITESFVNNLVDRFKNQKKIHRKIAYQVILYAFYLILIINYFYIDCFGL